MAEVTGPISTLSGASHDVPEGAKCDEHPDRPAVARIQGETDSFGSELHDMCAECLEADRAWRSSPEAAEWRKGQCEWCKNEAADLRDARDYDEGMTGRVYRVCGACIKRADDEARAELEANGYYDSDFDDYDDDDDWLEEECGLAADGQCSMAGTEHCDFVCPNRDSEDFAGSDAWNKKQAQ